MWKKPADEWLKHRSKKLLLFGSSEFYVSPVTNYLKGHGYTILSTSHVPPGGFQCWGFHGKQVYLLYEGEWTLSSVVKLPQWNIIYVVMNPYASRNTTKAKLMKSFNIVRLPTVSISQKRMLKFGDTLIEQDDFIYNVWEVLKRRNLSLTDRIRLWDGIKPLFLDGVHSSVVGQLQRNEIDLACCILEKYSDADLLRHSKFSFLDPLLPLCHYGRRLSFKMDSISMRKRKKSTLLTLEQHAQTKKKMRTKSK